MWRRYLRFWGADPPADVDAEIDFHLEELVRHLVARGMTPEQARAEASKRFGNVARVRSECVSVDEGSMKAAMRCRRIFATASVLFAGTRRSRSVPP